MWAAYSTAAVEGEPRVTERGPYPRSRGQQTDRATVVGARSAQNRPVRRGASASAECPRAGLRTKFAVAEWSLCPTRHGMFPRQRVPPPFAFRMRRQKPLAEGSRRRIGQTTYLLVGQGGRWLVSCATGTGWAPAKWRYPSLLPFSLRAYSKGQPPPPRWGVPPTPAPLRRNLSFPQTLPNGGRMAPHT